MLLITKRRKIGIICGHTIYAITKSEMIPIPHPSVRSNLAFSKDENRSLVNFTCTCNVSMVHFSKHIRVAFRTISCPLYFNVMNYGFLSEFIISCSEIILLDHHYYTLCSLYYIFVDLSFSSVRMHNVGFLKSTLSSFCGTL